MSESVTKLQKIKMILARMLAVFIANGLAIIGAGISGLFIANLFKSNPNYQITIYEKKNLSYFRAGIRCSTICK